MKLKVRTHRVIRARETWLQICERQPQGTAHMKDSSHFVRTNLETAGASYWFGLKHFPNPRGHPTSKWLLWGRESLDEEFKVDTGEASVRDHGGGMVALPRPEGSQALSAESYFLLAASYPACLGTCSF